MTEQLVIQIQVATDENIEYILNDQCMKTVITGRAFIKRKCTLALVVHVAGPLLSFDNVQSNAQYDDELG